MTCDAPTIADEYKTAVRACNDCKRDPVIARDYGPPKNVRTFAIGDVVRMKTGGPLMTVEYLGQRCEFRKPSGIDISASPGGGHADIAGGPRAVWCCWFVQHGDIVRGDAAQWSGPHRAAFDVDSLERCEMDPS